MNCPKCGKELLIRNEKVGETPQGEAIYNEFAICRDCRKKWNLDKQRAKRQAVQEAKQKEEQEAAKAQETAEVQNNNGMPETEKKERETPRREQARRNPAQKREEQSSGKEDESRYSNIPPRQVREKREQEMRDNYEHMLAQREGEEDDEVEVSSSKLPLFMTVISIMIILVAVLIAIFFIL